MANFRKAHLHLQYIFHSSRDPGFLFRQACRASIQVLLPYWNLMVSPSVDRQLGPGGRDPVARRRQDRPPQPRHLHLRRVPRFRGLGAVEHRRPQLAAAGFALTLDQQFWLIALPSLVGATLRLPYTFAVPLFGGRNWTIVSALLLLLPTLSLAYVVTRAGHPVRGAARCCGTCRRRWRQLRLVDGEHLLLLPREGEGQGLGLNAAGGNLGTAAVQFAVPIVIAIGAGFSLERAGLVSYPSSCWLRSWPGGSWTT